MNPPTKFALNLISILLAALLFAPTAAIVVSWNALPGDSLYSTKRTLEKIALAITAGNYSTNSTLQTQLLARRTNEAVGSVLKKSSSKGLDELRAQLAQIRQQVAAAPTPEEKQAAAQKAVAELETTKKKLRQTRVTLARGPTTTISVQQQIIQYIPIPVQQPSTGQSSVDLTQQIQDTEDDIDDAIDDLSSNLGSPTPAPSPSPSQSPSPSPSPIPSPSPAPTSCQQYCLNLGYDSGTCRQNPNKCSMSGETYESGGDAYCTSDPGKTACCCEY